MIFTLSNGVVFDCRFSVATWSQIGNLYQCLASVVIAGSDNILLDIRGNHLSGKTHFDVEALELKNQDLKSIPRPIAASFSNIKGISWYNSNLWSLTSDDLRPFPNLMNLNVYGNKLISLEGDLFKCTKKLLIINFNNNLLYHVGPDFLTNLVFLNEARFQSNPCISDYENTRSRIPILNERIASRCPPEEVTSTTVLLETTSTTESPGQCSDACLQLIVALEANLLELQESNEKQQGKLAESDERISELERKVREIPSQPCTTC